MSNTLDENLSGQGPRMMDCVYSSQGPRQCVLVYYEVRDERKYGTCTVGDQVRRMQMLPHLFASTRQVSCPSNRVVGMCQYLTNEKVKLT